jgi:CheY-like chemotaxis protein
MADIIVLEDDFTLLDLYREVLQREGHTVYATTSVQAVDEFFHQNTADLCIADLRVGLVDAKHTIQTMKRIRQRYHVPIILISAQMMLFEDTCREAGFEYMLSKPFPNSKLIEWVNRVLTTSQSAGS